MKILVSCEFSGVVRSAFRNAGHDAWSCDLLPAADDSPFHIQGDVMKILNDGWERMIAHPDCTYLTNSAEWAYADGPYHQKVKPETLVGSARREAREQALLFVRALLDAPIREIALENPCGVIGTRIRPASQFIQPWEFGDDASKKTGLWLKGLPLLRPTIIAPPRIVEWPKGSSRFVKRWANQSDGGQNNLPPSEDRWKLRAVTYPGIAKAMAHQWR